MRKPAFWIILILIVVVIYLAYKAFVYYTCKNDEGKACGSSFGVRGKTLPTDPIDVPLPGQQIVTCNFWKGKVCRALTDSELAIIATGGKG